MTVSAVAVRSGPLCGGALSYGSLSCRALSYGAVPVRALRLPLRLVGLPSVRAETLAVAGSWAAGKAAGVALLPRHRNRGWFGRSLRLPVRAGPGIGGHAPIIAKPRLRGALFITCVIPLAWWDHCTSRELRARG
jgi:hypothetical protein